MQWKPVLLAILVAGVVATAAAAAPATRFYEDPSGDSGAAPDVAQVDVGNDLVKGTIVMWVSLPNRTALGADDALLVYIDADLNGATGSSSGTDYGITVDDSGATFYRWNGTDYAQAPAGSLDASFVAEEKAVRIEIHPADLGGTRGFNFFFVTVTGDATDVAPDGDAVWTYSLATGQLVLTKAGGAATPARAGRPFAIGVRVNRSDINETLAEGAITCSLRVGKATIRARLAEFVDDVATCGWGALPKSAKGKKLVATITVRYGGASVSHAVTTTVRK